MDGKKIISGVTQPKNKRMDAFQSCVFVVTVFALLLSTVTLMRSNSNSTELFLIRERIQELEIQLSEVLVIPDSPRKLPGKFSNSALDSKHISIYNVGFDDGG